MVVLFVKLPEVPVMVTVAAPAVAVLLAVSVKVLVAMAGLGLKEAVTPLGKPDAEKLTLPLKPFWGVSEIVLEPLAPCVTVKLLGEAESVKLARDRVYGEGNRGAVRQAARGAGGGDGGRACGGRVAGGQRQGAGGSGRVGLKEAATPLGKPDAGQTDVAIEAILGSERDRARAAGSLRDGQAAGRGRECEALDGRRPRPVIYQVRGVDGPNSSREVPILSSCHTLARTSCWKWLELRQRRKPSSIVDCPCNSRPCRPA